MVRFTVSPIIYNFLIDSIDILKLDIDRVEGVLGFHLKYREERVLFIIVLKLWKTLEQLSGRSDIGLILADHFTTKRANLLGEVFLNSRNIKEGVLLVNRYFPLLLGNVSIRYEEIGERAIFRFDFFPESFIPLSVLEFYIKICFNWVSEFLDREGVKKIKIYELHYFNKKRPKHIDYYINNFPDMKVYFSDLYNYAILDKSIFYIPNRHYQKSVYEYVMGYADSLKTNILKRNNFSSYVADHILMDLSNRSNSIEQLANDMNISVSSIKRQLKAENCSFSKLSNNIKKELCSIMILDKNLFYEDISFLLGYSDYSAFYKAFKKWFKVTPSQYRERYLNV